MKYIIPLLSFVFLVSCECMLTTDEAAPLKISEVGSTYYSDSSAWIEIYNPTNVSVILSKYVLRSYDQNGYIKMFSLPALTIEPGSYVIIRAKPYSGLVDSDRIGYVSSGGSYPYWQANGFVELIYSNYTIDFVRFGGSTVSPMYDGLDGNPAWNGGSAVSLPFSSNSYGFSLSRNPSQIDTDTSSDFTVKTATPGGPNDITSTNDADQDGIPDCSEVPGGTFAGLPLYDWGARTNQKDIFIHVCYMDSQDEGVIPRGEALDKVVEAFAKKGIRVHFDVGNLNLSGQATNNHNLDNENHRVPREIPITVYTETGFGNLHKYKVKYMDLRKKQIFHFLLFAYSQEADGSDGSSGIAECPGNDFVVSLGNWGLNSSDTLNKNILINYQAATIMHEFGHNLGLRHGGSTDENYKPNYYSIMNYMYQLYGLPEIGNSREGDRYYYYRWLDVGNTSFSNHYFSGISPAEAHYALHRGPTNTNMVIDYSDGSGSSINENSISEAAGLGRSGSAGVDFNGNGVISGTITTNLNPTETNGITTLYDYNDWGNINLFFARTWAGDIQGATLKVNDKLTLLPDPVGDDRQPVVIETLKPPFWLKKK
ncbi:MAG: hypothetical protein WHS77_07955 [Brevinematales bacterium]